MSAWTFGALVLAGGFLAARLSPDDPLTEALAAALHAEVDGLEPTITCTPKEEKQ
ncbi:hypothetical protein OIE13_22675 [Streptosporangium sp. NBC_01810]|uniref:hypothetical protein n=1 Tax=Streptosporangium sp. NBC_01810 TaxID=2975951 RepID=UPI002DD9C70F|nr:hypothetical protein [Streptosporangium sp. NBC_01810]WSA23750.1 hypothetical protein OIE13_22675 [Streptosporangium sp. NBC_01810]